MLDVSAVRAALERAKIENAAHEARLLCEAFQGEALERAVERRITHEPLQYILGEWGFWRETYEVSPDCLVPRPDTEHLVERAISLLPTGARFLDLCTGSGCVAISTLCSRPDTTACALDLFPRTLALAERNALRNGVADRVTFQLADVLKTPPSMGQFDAILSNPPYMRADSGKRNESEEKYLARHEVCGGIADFCMAASRLLKYGGRFLCVWRPDRLCDLLSALRKAGLEPKRMQFVHADPVTEPSIVLVDATKGASPSLRIAAPLFLYEPAEKGESRRRLTAQAQRIYDTCSFPEE